MNLYLLSQEENSDYDTFDSCLVCAENEEEAKSIHPYNEPFVENERWLVGTWASKKENVKCELIGVASKDVKKGVVIASFNAG